MRKSDAYFSSMRENGYANTIDFAIDPEFYIMQELQAIGVARGSVSVGSDAKGRSILAFHLPGEENKPREITFIPLDLAPAGDMQIKEINRELGGRLDAYYQKAGELLVEDYGYLHFIIPWLKPGAFMVLNDYKSGLIKPFSPKPLLQGRFKERTREIEEQAKIVERFHLGKPYGWRMSLWQMGIFLDTQTHGNYAFSPAATPSSDSNAACVAPAMFGDPLLALGILALGMMSGASSPIEDKPNPLEASGLWTKAQESDLPEEARRIWNGEVAIPAYERNKSLEILLKIGEFATKLNQLKYHSDCSQCWDSPWRHCWDILRVMMLNRIKQDNPLLWEKSSHIMLPMIDATFSGSFEDNGGLFAKRLEAVRDFGNKPDPDALKLINAALIFVVDVRGDFVNHTPPVSPNILMVPFLCLPDALKEIPPGPGEEIGGYYIRKPASSPTREPQFSGAVKLGSLSFGSESIESMWEDYDSGWGHKEQLWRGLGRLIEPYASKAVRELFVPSTSIEACSVFMRKLRTAWVHSLENAMDAYFQAKEEGVINQRSPLKIEFWGRVDRVNGRVDIAMVSEGLPLARVETNAQKKIAKQQGKQRFGSSNAGNSLAQICSGSIGFFLLDRLSEFGDRDGVLSVLRFDLARLENGIGELRQTRKDSIVTAQKARSSSPAALCAAPMMFADPLLALGFLALGMMSGASSPAESQENFVWPKIKSILDAGGLKEFLQRLHKTQLLEFGVDKDGSLRLFHRLKWQRSLGEAKLWRMLDKKKQWNLVFGNNIPVMIDENGHAMVPVFEGFDYGTRRLSDVHMSKLGLEKVLDSYGKPVELPCLPHGGRGLMVPGSYSVYARRAGEGLRIINTEKIFKATPRNELVILHACALQIKGVGHARTGIWLDNVHLPIGECEEPDGADTGSIKEYRNDRRLLKVGAQLSTISLGCIKLLDKIQVPGLIGAAIYQNFRLVIGDTRRIWDFFQHMTLCGAGSDDKPNFDYKSFVLETYPDDNFTDGRDKHLKEFCHNIGLNLRALFKARLAVYYGNNTDDNIDILGRITDSGDLVEITARCAGNGKFSIGKLVGNAARLYKQAFKYEKTNFGREEGDNFWKSEYLTILVKSFLGEEAGSKLIEEFNFESAECSRRLYCGQSIDYYSGITEMIAREAGRVFKKDYVPSQSIRALETMCKAAPLLLIGLGLAIFGWPTLLALPVLGMMKDTSSPLGKSSQENPVQLNSKTSSVKFELNPVHLIHTLIPCMLGQIQEETNRLAVIVNSLTPEEKLSEETKAKLDELSPTLMFKILDKWEFSIVKSIISQLPADAFVEFRDFLKILETEISHPLITLLTYNEYLTSEIKLKDAISQKDIEDFQKSIDSNKKSTNLLLNLGEVRLTKSRKGMWVGRSTEDPEMFTILVKPILLSTSVTISISGQRITLSEPIKKSVIMLSVSSLPAPTAAAQAKVASLPVYVSRESVLSRAYRLSGELMFRKIFYKQLAKFYSSFTTKSHPAALRSVLNDFIKATYACEISRWVSFILIFSLGIWIIYQDFPRVGAALMFLTLTMHLYPIFLNRYSRAHAKRILLRIPTPACSRLPPEDSSSSPLKSTGVLEVKHQSVPSNLIAVGDFAFEITEGLYYLIPGVEQAANKYIRN
ncbi:MAG: hypothetical protein NT060_01610, partial [Candidatus Omnitrophica bacterium]|nr:hypothetical protein [Candidatus Omnitrophota bacterium]